MFETIASALGFTATAWHTALLLQKALGNRLKMMYEIFERVVLATTFVSGENEAVRQAVGRPAIINRGVRILSMDGGGMKVLFYAFEI